MENIQKPKLGAGIITLSIIQLVYLGLALIGFALMYIPEFQSMLKEMGITEITNSALITIILIVLTTIIGIVLILMKKDLGIYIYYIAVIANIVYKIVVNGFSSGIIFSLIFPILMGFFIRKKKEVFAVTAKG